MMESADSSHRSRMILKKKMNWGPSNRDFRSLKRLSTPLGRIRSGSPRKALVRSRRNHHTQDRMILSCLRPNRKRSKSSTDNLGLYQDDVWGRSRGHLGTTLVNAKISQECKGVLAMADTDGNPQPGTPLDT